MLKKSLHSFLEVLLAEAPTYRGDLQPLGGFGQLPERAGQRQLDGMFAERRIEAN
jgi:hypothetical protein